MVVPNPATGAPVVVIRKTAEMRTEGGGYPGIVNGVNHAPVIRHVSLSPRQQLSQMNTRAVSPRLLPNASPTGNTVAVPSAAQTHAVALSPRLNASRSPTTSPRLVRCTPADRIANEFVTRPRGVTLPADLSAKAPRQQQASSTSPPSASPRTQMRSPTLSPRLLPGTLKFNVRQQATFPEPSSRKGSSMSPRTEEAASLIEAALGTRDALNSHAIAIFSKANVNRDGKLSFFAVREALSELATSMRFKLDLSELHADKFLENQMRRYDMDGDEQLNTAEFAELCRLFLWKKYEGFINPLFSRSRLLGEAHRGMPSQFYHVGKKLGQGSFGVINEAFDRTSRSRRVMKTISKMRCLQSGMPIHAIKAEIDILACLDHPHVLRLYEHYSDTQNVYMILDVCDGGELMDVFVEYARARRSIPELFIAKVSRQVLEALSYIHNKGVMHKDLKFENIMLRDKIVDIADIAGVHATIIDVGLAELFGRQHGKGDRSSLLAGSPETMAPEVIAQNFSYKCDIWSLGCMLFAVFNPTVSWVPNTSGVLQPKAYPFVLMPSPTDPIGMQSIHAAQLKGPPMHLLAGSRTPVQETIKRMLTHCERQRPTASECLLLPWFVSSSDESDVIFSSDQAEALILKRANSLWTDRTMLAAATELPASSLQGLSELFRSVDTNHDGFVSREEMSAALKKVGIDQETASRTVDKLNFDELGRIEYSEFVAVVLPGCHELLGQALQIAFQKFDENHDGYLDKREVTSLLESGELQSMHLPPARAVDMMMKQIDVSESGKISFEEFQKHFLQLHGERDRR
eukprot:TRINITY_DN33156_c1_g2_i1.p1 TRINITY_DN33156_c1_g2~~TRINITY_DN33156_c1_g2_i1.p1  ORF type:complete len:802 (+),score=120.19 TRINITY_DN33156_c1_g2_i1:42-2447(+)